MTLDPRLTEEQPDEDPEGEGHDGVGDRARQPKKDDRAPSTNTGGHVAASTGTFYSDDHPSDDSSCEAGPGESITIAGLPRVGQIVFGRYLVVGPLGKGGMGTVWLVRHTELKAQRALKLILSNIAFLGQVRARFKREARVMARLSHPNAVTVHHAQMGTDAAFIEMEYIRGQSLDKLLTPGVPMPLDWTARIVEQLCDVLQVAHDAKIVHRDLKPSNLMLVGDRPPGKEFLKVLDFGLAKVLEPSSDPSDVYSKPGSYVGSASWSSPEQLSGGNVDGRSDLYSVGIILYELLTGARPFSGKASLIYQHVSTPPPPFATINPSLVLPPAVEQAVLHCLAKNPDDRPQTARDLAAEFLWAVYDQPGSVSRSEPPARPVTIGPRPAEPNSHPIMSDSTSVERPEVAGAPRPPLVIGPGADPGVGHAVRTPAPAGIDRSKWWPLSAGGRQIAILVSAVMIIVAFLCALKFASDRPAGGPSATAPVKTVGAGRARGGETGVDFVLEAILADVLRLPQGSRRFARYVSLNHLLAAEFGTHELALQRDALAGTLNHLSGKPDIITPWPIDRPKTVFRIDLRELGWDKQPFQRFVDAKPLGPSPVNMFDLVLLEYPYGVVFEASESLDKLERVFLQSAGQVRPIPYVQADWFVSTVTQPPLRDDFFQSPPPLNAAEGRPGRDKPLLKPEPEEPLIVASKRLFDAPLSLPAVVAALDMSSAAELRPSFAAQPFARLGLAPLATGGSIGRDRWEAAFDRVVRDLKQGIPIVALDALTRPNIAPAAAEFDVGLATNKTDNLFSPGDSMVITVVNPSSKPVRIELIMTGIQGKKVILAPGTTVILPGRSFHFPPEGAIRIRAGLGKEQITVFASDAEFPRGELLRGDNVADRIVHPFGDVRHPTAGGFDPARVLKKTIVVETR